jgi:hypothetical protein
MYACSFSLLSTFRNARKSRALSDRRCKNVLVNLGLIEEHRRLQAEVFLQKMHKVVAQNIHGAGDYSNHISKKKSHRIQYFMLLFNGTLQSRAEETSRVKSLESKEISLLTAAGDKAETVATAVRTLTTDDNDDDSDCDDGSSVDRDRNADSDASSISDEEEELDEITPPAERCRTDHTTQLQNNTVTESPKSRLRKTREKNGTALSLPARPALTPPLAPKHPSSPTTRKPKTAIAKKKRSKLKGYGEAAIMLREVFTIFQVVWLSCAQLALIISFFRNGKLKKTGSFGTYRVELICMLFNRLVDVHNFEIITHLLDSQEVACVYCRVGLLHVFNPLKPEGWHCLNMGTREERTVAKMLMVLSVEEPGKNFIDASFRWKFDMKAIPGWALPARWMLDKHVPHHGFLHLEFYAGRKRREGGGNAVG